jgi:hypothetical protein
MKARHLPEAVLLVLVGEKPKEKEKRRKRAGSASEESSRPRMDRAGGRLAAGCRQRRRW